MNKLSIGQALPDHTGTAHGLAELSRRKLRDALQTVLGCHDCLSDVRLENLQSC